MRTFESDFERDLYAARLQTLETIADLGVELGLSRAEAKYPNRFPRIGQADTIPTIRSTYDQTPADEFDRALAAGKPITVAIAGRIMAIRTQGKAGFAQLQQGGQRLQIYVRKDSVGDTAFALYKLLDLGDHIGVHGYLFRTRTGELTVHVGPAPTPGSLTPADPTASSSEPTNPHPPQPITFLAKSLLALPDKYHGLEDVELRYRQRYVDLIMNSGTLAKSESATTPETSQATHGVFNPVIPCEARNPRISPEATHASSPETTDLLAASPGSSPALDAILSDQPTPTTPGPGSSAVTETADPDNEHRDAPRNVREVFVKRAQILRSIRRFFDERGYLEVETPMMHTVAGGAAARPFKTHHNALDIDLSLRIAPELYLKRLVVGGLDRVYEINRNFRNEGVSTQHNPEFTMLEFYQAYSNYKDLMKLTRELIAFVAVEVNGTTITKFNGKEIDLVDWDEFRMVDALVKFWPKYAGVPPSLSDFHDRNSVAALLVRLKADASNVVEKLSDGDRSQLRTALQVRDLFEIMFQELQAGGEYGRTIASLFEMLIETELTKPTIIYDFPLAVSPLSKQKPDEPDWVERFEFYIGGFEVGNAFSELNDPEVQRKRFEQQLAERDRGDDEAHAMDEDYVRALGYGLPPTAGEGIGIDRLTMLLTGSRSIRDVILFPLLRPQTPRPEPRAES